MTWNRGAGARGMGKNMRVPVICALLLILASPAMTQEEIPALIEMPPDVATNRPDLVTERARLLRERQALHVKTDSYNAACGAVEEGSAQESSCRSADSVLVSEIRAHVRQSAAFNAAVRRVNTSCVQVAALQSQFESLTQQIFLDRHVVQRFGFERTVAEIEYWGGLPARQVEDAKNAFRAMLFDATLDAVSESVGAVGSLTQEEVDALNRLADAQGEVASEIVAGANDLNTTREFLDKTKRAYETADAVRRHQMLDAAVKLGGLASKNPAFGLLLTADEWATYQLYRSATAVRAVHDLTKANEGDLILLKSRSERLKNEVNQLTGVNKQLAHLSSECDSTRLVHKPD